MNFKHLASVIKQLTYLEIIIIILVISTVGSCTRACMDVIHNDSNNTQEIREVQEDTFRYSKSMM